jgi:Tol biopolymer transport system component
MGIFLDRTWARAKSTVVGALAIALVFLAAGCGTSSTVVGGPTPSPTPSPTPVPACASPANSNNAILYTSQLSPDCSNIFGIGQRVWILNPDGTGDAPLTPDTFFTGDPAWSPNGAKIAFTSGRALDGGNGSNMAGNVWVMNPDGTGGVPLTKITVVLANCDTPVWSPDGTKIAFLSPRALDGSNALGKSGDIAPQNLWVMNADGSGAKPLTMLNAFEADVSQVAWSPDSQRMVYQSSRALDGSDAASNVHNTWIVNADGSGDLPLTSFTSFASRTLSATWSPDGSKIVFVSGSQISVMNPDGSGATQLTSISSNFDPAWSPDGTKIAFASGRALDGSNNNGVGLNVWVMNADGSGALPLSKFHAATASCCMPAWSANGQQIAFQSGAAVDGSNGDNQGDNLNIWVVNANGSGLMPLTKNIFSGPHGQPLSNTHPLWRP